MKKLNWRLTSMFTVLSVAAAASGAHAGGFEVKTRSASLIGQAGAGSGVQTGDMTTISHNNAILSTVDTGVSAGGSLIFPSIKFKNAGSVRTGTTALTGGNGKNAGSGVFVPNAYVAYKYRDDVRFGLAITSPFGLETNYGNLWAGRYHATKSMMRTVNFNPMVSYDCGNNLKFAGMNMGSLAVGAGVQVQYMDVELNRAVDTGLLIGASQTRDSFVKLKADSWGLGWTAGLLWKPANNTRIGLAYKSHVAQKLVGDSSTRLGITQAQLDGNAAFRAALQNQKAEASLDTPDQLTLSAWHDINDAWSVGADVMWTHWNRVKNVSIRFPNTTAAQQTLALGFQNTMFYALGANWKFHPDWLARIGVAYDQSAANTNTRMPAVPDSKRYWTAVGFDWSPMGNLKLSLNYAHEFVPAAKISLNEAGRSNFDNTKGTLIGKFRNQVDIIGASVSYKF